MLKQVLLVGALALQTLTPTQIEANYRLAGAAPAGAWLPTMDTLAVPVLDWWSPLAANAAWTYVGLHGEVPIPPWAAVIGQRPLGRSALLRLVLQGRLAAAGGLPRAPRGSARNGERLGSWLRVLAVEPLAPGIERGELLAQVLAELDVPARVTQGAKATCEAASTQIMLAERDPGEYVRLVAGLASPGGVARLANGDELRRAPDWASATDGWRSTPSRLLQPAFASYGNAELGYDNTRDANGLGSSGLTDRQLTRLLSGVFAVPFTYVTGQDGMAAYRAAIAAGWHVPVWLLWSTGHIVLAEPEAGGRVVIDNPYGAMHSLTPAAFKAALHSVYVPAR